MGLNSTILPCCIAKDLTDGSNTTKGLTVEQLMNADSMKLLRTDMLKGIQNESCSTCYQNESHGVKSLRQWSNEQYWQESFLEKTEDDGFLRDLEIKTLDLRLSNLCNFKCRTCGPGFSTSWYEDHNKMSQQKHQKHLNSTSNFKSFISELIQLLPSAKKIQFAGGEPLIIEQHYQILEKCIELDLRELVISYHTNLSTLSYKDYDLFQLWRFFKKVRVSVSIDDLFDRGEYLRAGLKWDQLLANLNKVKEECENVLLSINVTVSIFNIYYLDEIYDFFQTSKLIDMENLDFTLVYDPEIYCIQTLPHDFKRQVREKLKTFFGQLEPNGEDLIFRNAEIEGILDFMDAKDCSHLISKVVDRTNELDRIRGEKLDQVYPELSLVIGSDK
jgi:molybdenum cofactor biosynthesis enzyme MoaA